MGVPSVWWCGVLGGVDHSGRARWCGCPRCGGVVSSVVWIIQGGRGGAVWCPRCGGVGVLGGVPPSVAYMQPTPRRARNEAPQCGGGLACESMLQGEIEDSDCSNYQLFRCPSWDAFYRSVCRLKRWLLTFYRGERIIRNVRNTLNSDRFYSKIRNKKTISKEKYTKTI